MKLIAKNLNKKYGDRCVVNDVSLELDKGEIVGLLGPNGAGKTTTFYMLVGLIRSFSGDVMINNKNISSDPMHIRARKGLGYLPQQPSVFTKMSVEDNILTVLETLSFNKKQKKRKSSKLLFPCDSWFPPYQIKKSFQFLISLLPLRAIIKYNLSICYLSINKKMYF